MANFQKLLSRKHATLIDSILVNAWNEKERFEKLTGISEYVRNLEIIDGDFYFDAEWIDAITVKYANQTREFFLDFVGRGYKHGDRLVAFARSAGNKRNSLGIFKESIELMKDLLVFLPVTHPLAKVIERKLVSIFKSKNLPEDKINEMLLSVSKPVKLNGPALEVKELKEIRDKMAESEQEGEAALATHAAKFSYLGYREPFSQGYDLKFFRQRLNESLESTTAIPDVDLELSAKEQPYVDLMREFVYFRNYRTERFYESLYYLEPIWQKVSISLGLNSRDLFYYLETEINDLFSKKTKISAETLEERKKGYALLLHNDQVLILTCKELAAHKKIREGIVGGMNTIKGMTACKGTVRGTARIVLKASEQSKVQAGDILVTSMTTPDFVPCMQRASAFVTDEGGITCHAAIVAREMNKPCIIGTKIATKVLKDGDFVEVDADAGVVRVVK